MKTFSILIYILLLSACDSEQANPLSHTNEALPNIPLEIDLMSFDLPVQQQFSQRLKYINLIQKQSKDKSKYGWAIGQLGKTYQAYQKTDEARDSYLNAIANDPRTIEWPYLLAHIYKTIGEFDQSAKYFNRVLLLEDYTPAKIWLTDILLQQNKYKQAQNINKDVLLSNNNHPMALYQQGLISQFFEDDELAIKYLNKILIQQPDAYQVHYQLGQIFQRLGLTKKAKQHLNQVADDSNLRVSIEFEDPFMQSVADLRRGAQSIIKIAVKASTQGQHKAAISLLKKAIKDNPDRIDIVYNLAIVYLKAKQKNKAKLLLEQIIDKQDDKVYILMSKINKIEGQYNQAIDNLQKAIKIKPNNPYYLSNLADVYMLTNDFIKAENYYNQSLDIDPEQEIIQLKRMRALLQEDDNFNLIVNLLNKRAFSQKFNQIKLNILARIALATSNHNTKAQLTQIEFPESAMSYTTMAMSAAKNNDFEMAVIHQGKALNLALSERQKNTALARLKKYQKDEIYSSIWLATESLVYE